VLTANTCWQCHFPPPLLEYHITLVRNGTFLELGASGDIALPSCYPQVTKSVCKWNQRTCLFVQWKNKQTNKQTNKKTFDQINSHSYKSSSSLFSSQTSHVGSLRLRSFSMRSHGIAEPEVLSLSVSLLASRMEEDTLLCVALLAWLRVNI